MSRRRLAAAAGIALLTTAPAAMPVAAETLGYCDNATITIQAAQDGQVVHGTSGADVISAQGHRDVVVYGEGGDDRICAVPDRSSSSVPAMAAGVGVTFYGGPGDDRLFGSSGDDRLVGGPGDDHLGGVGQEMAPLPSGGDGGADILDGEDGDDTIDNTFTTLAYGHPELHDSTAAVLSGGPGRDTMTGAGAFSGGPGDDRIAISNGVVGTSTVSGGAGSDQLRFGRSILGDQDTRHSHIDARTRVETDPGGGRTTWTSVEKYDGGNGPNTFIGSAAPETYFSSQGHPGARDDVDMGGGDDVVYLATGTAHTGAGDDTAYLSNGGHVWMGSGDDVVYTGWDDYGDSQRFQVRLGSGNDALRVSNGIDDGGDASPTPAKFKLVSGGSGNDLVSLRGLASAVIMNLASGRGTWRNGYMNLRAVEHLDATQHRDVIFGTSHRDRIHGLGGNDVIRGRGGSDELRGGRGRDRLYGGPGNDTAYGGHGHDTCRAEHRHSC